MFLRTELPMFGMAPRIGRSEIGYCDLRPTAGAQQLIRHCPLRVVPTRAVYDNSALRIKILKLEPVTYCNLQCPVCPVEAGFKQVPELRETRGQKQLPLNVMLDVVDQLPDLELIEYFDYGEPFIHRDTVTFLREVRRTRPGCRIVTNTNGTVMTPEQIRAIAKNRSWIGSYFRSMVQQRKAIDDIASGAPSQRHSER